MACCSNAKSWWNAEFRVDDRLRPCKYISLEFPSHNFIVGLSTRVGEQPNCDSTCFYGCEFFFAIRLYTRNDSHLQGLICQICILGWVVRVLRFISERLPVLFQTVCFCCSGKGRSAPTLFKSSEPKPGISFPEPPLTASERLNPFYKSNVRTNLRSQKTIQLFKTKLLATLKWDFRTDRCILSWYRVYTRGQVYTVPETMP